MIDAILDVVLAVSVVGLGGAVVISRRPVRSSVLFTILSLLMAVVWVRLGAPDVALAEVAVGAGVIGALLIDTAILLAGRRDRPGDGDEISRSTALVRRARPIVAAGVGVLFVAGAVVAMYRLPDEPPGVAEAVADAEAETGISQPITALLLSLRPLDTWLEMAVLLGGALGMVVVAGRSRVADELSAVDAGEVEERWVRYLSPLLLLVGVYVLSRGTFSVGGAFQAGAVIGAAAVLAWVTGHRLRLSSGDRSVSGLMSAGFIAFLAVAAITLVTGTALAVRGGAGSIVVHGLEIAIAVSVAYTVVHLFVAGRVADQRAVDPPHEGPP